MKGLFRALFGLVLRVFFRRIEVSGAERVPAAGPVIFVLNHPNGLIDPAFLLCLAPRRVSFLAKAPLFRMPVIGFFCRALEAIPVHRRQDEGSDPSQNRETFETARAVLGRGGAIAVFPEGGSHSDPKLRPLKTGAARIALGAAAALAGSPPIRVVPTGLYYRAKRTFRSAALLYFGEPFAVRPVPLAPGEEPPAGPVRDLTGAIERALAAVTLQAEQAEAHALVERAQRIVTAQDEAPAVAPSLAEEFALRRRLLAGYYAVRAQWPERFCALASRIDRYEAALAAAGLEPRQLAPRSYAGGRVARYVGKAVLFFLLLLPTALVGVVLHYPAYRAVGFVATGVAKGAEDALASVKVLAAMLLFPVTWAALTVGAWLWRGVAPALLALLLAPLTAYAALLFFERLDRVIGAARAFGLFAFRRRAFLRLVAERRAIQEEIVMLGREIEGAAMG
ncbi:MAG TPA: 1-acyl-sn-glycerol-3-phosphate acyltransferase [Gemmatimonadales bacterium]|nr:1-acyl-sn-glycerol-3-phosphate acyltransferase [Gemmatimonadales bacterium]